MGTKIKTCIVFVSLMFLYGCSGPNHISGDKKGNVENGEWLYGDLHMHTKYSDGKYSYEDTLNFCVEAGFDYAATTDHNTAEQNYEENIYGELLIIPGMEDTTSFGHSNILGLIETPCSINSFKNESAELFGQVARDIRKDGGKITICHPFIEEYKWDRDFSKENYDYLEIWNSVFDSSDQRAVDYWQEQLAKGEIIPAVGGTDSHIEKILRSPYNVTFVREKSQDGILNALSEGHNYIVYHPSVCSLLEFKYGEYMMGDIAEYKGGLKLNISVGGVKEDMKLMLFNQDGCACEVLIDKEKGLHNFKYSVSADDLFFRIMIVGFGGKTMLITNPIYIRN